MANTDEWSDEDAVRYGRMVEGRTSAALQHKASQGEFTGGHAPYGYRVGEDGVHLVEEPAEQVVIARVCELRAACGSLRSIPEVLVAEGFRSRDETNLLKTQVERILREFYQCFVTTRGVPINKMNRPLSGSKGRPDVVPEWLKRRAGLAEEGSAMKLLQVLFVSEMSEIKVGQRFGEWLNAEGAEVAKVVKPQAFAGICLSGCPAVFGCDINGSTQQVQAKCRQSGVPYLTVDNTGLRCRHDVKALLASLRSPKTPVAPAEETKPSPRNAPAPLPEPEPFKADVVEPATSTVIEPFDFRGHEVRAVPKGGRVWFVAKDACDILDLEHVSNAVKRLKNDDRTTITVIDTIGRKQEAWGVSREGLWDLVLESRKQEAQDFKHWLTHEVIPALERKGYYIVGEKPGDDGPARLRMLESLVAHEKGLQEQKALVAEQGTKIARLEQDAGAAITLAGEAERAAKEALEQARRLPDLIRAEVDKRPPLAPHPSAQVDLPGSPRMSMGQRHEFHTAVAREAERIARLTYPDGTAGFDALNEKLRQGIHYRCRIRTPGCERGTANVWPASAYDTLIGKVTEYAIEKAKLLGVAY